MLISRRMNLLPADLAYLRDQLSELAAILHERREAASIASDDGESPRLLGHAATQLFDALGMSVRQEAFDATWSDEITTLGEYGQHLLAKLEALAIRLDSPDIQVRLEQLNLPLALWIARHGGEIRNLAPAVNALADLANHANEPRAMAALYTHCCELLDAASPACAEGHIHQDHPWRLLLLNRAIIATRSHNAELMSVAFDAIVEQLPDDARHFFSEGMQQISEMACPDQARDVMKRYYLACANPRQLH